MCETAYEGGGQTKRQIIVPRKGVQELQRLLEGGDREVELEMGRGHIRVKRDDVTFTSKLIDGRFPDYEAVIPIGADKEVRIDREVLRASLQRAAILSNEKYRGVRIEVSPGQLKISAHNPEQEEAQEEVEADTKVDDLAVGSTSITCSMRCARCATTRWCWPCATPTPRRWCARRRTTTAGTW